MRYVEAEILKIEDAVAAIQNIETVYVSKPMGLYLEYVNPANYSTVSAYEADE